MTILLESAGSYGKINLINCLREDSNIRIIGTDYSNDSPCQSLFDAFYITPSWKDDRFLETLVEICNAEKCSYIYPLATYSLDFFSKQRDYFEKHNIKLVISSPDSIRIANNKLHLYEHIKKTIPQHVPDFYLTKNLDEFHAAIKALGYPEKNVCVRLPVSTGGAGFRIITSNLGRILENFLTLPPMNSFITLNTFLEYFAVNKSFTELIVQEYLPGEEWDIDCLSLDGRLIRIFTKRNNIMLGGVSVDCDVVENPVLEKLTGEIINSIGLNYINQVTFMYDELGVPKVIEINPRPPVSIDASLKGGVNFPMLLYKLLNGDVDSPSLQYGYKYGRLFSGISW